LRAAGLRGKADQTITFGALGGKTFGDSDSGFGFGELTLTGVSTLVAAQIACLHETACAT
jgi:hypothetical protein